MNTKTYNEMVNANSMVIAGKKLGLVSVEEMFIDNTYQRSLQGKVNKIASSWDDNKCDILQISYRPDLDKYAIIDGQNRWAAACRIGRTHLLCQIFEGLSIKDEAKIFAEQNDNVSKISSSDKFKSLLVMGDEISLQIKEVCDNFGISIRKTYGDSLCKNRKNLNGLTSARRIVESHGINSLKWMFNVIEKSGWDLTSRAYTDRSLQILLTFYKSRFDKGSFDIDTEKLINLYANVGEYNGLIAHANKYVLDRHPRNDGKAFTEREAIICYIEHMIFNK